MKVKAKWNVKDAMGWHPGGEIFETNEDLGDAVEVLEAAKAPELVLVQDPEPETVKVVEPEHVAEPEPQPEAEPAPAKTRSTTRRKVSTTK